MYRKVLAAVNEHLNSEVAAATPCTWPGPQGQTLPLLCPAAGTDGGGLRARPGRSPAPPAPCTEIDIDAECLFETGDPVEKIRAIVLAEGIDLVFTATRREDVKHRIIRGGTTARSSYPASPAPWRSSVSCTWAGPTPGRSSSHSRNRSITSRALRVHRPACKGLRGQGPSLSCDQACEEVLPRRDAPDPRGMGGKGPT